MRQQTTSGRRKAWWTLLFAVVVSCLSIWLCFIEGLVPLLPFGLILLFAVVLSAYAGGLWAGLLSTVLGATASAFLLHRVLSMATHRGSFKPELIWLFAIVFSIMGVIVSSLFEALHRSRSTSDGARRQLATTLANVSDAIITTNARGQIEYLNQTAILLLQCDAQQVIGEPFEAIVRIRNVNDGQPTLHLVDEVRDGAHTIHVGNSQVLLRDDGKCIAVETTAAPVRNASGEVMSVVVTLRDCSAQREVENVLRERLALQSRFERIAAVVPGAICEFQTFVDGNEKLLYASPGFKDIFGVDPAIFAANAAGFRAMVVAEDAADSREATDTAAVRLESINMEQRVMTPHHGVRWVTVIATPHREPDGSVLWHGVLTDTTESKRSGARLRASQTQLQAALDAGAMGIISANFATRTAELDAMARQLWGLDEHNYPVVTFADLAAVMHPESPRIGIKEAERMASDARLVIHQYHLLMKDGGHRWLVWQGRVYRDEASGELVAAGVVMDVTQDHLNEQQRLRAQKLAALGVMAGGIAHDFNNLLLAISGNANLLLSDLPERDPARTSVDEISKAASRASELVRRILNFSSASEFIHAERTAVLKPMLDEVLASTRATLPIAVSLTTHIADALPTIGAAGSQVHQTLINLLTNAVEACVAAGGGVISLMASAVVIDDEASGRLPEVQPGRYVCISVADDGNGIEPDVLPRIFDPFFTTKVAGSGNGLGLAVVHGIMKSIHGAITTRSTRGQGAKFSLYFPVAAQAGTASSTQPGATNVAVVGTSASPEKSAVHILYVDDEEALIFLMSRTLERMGHHITACESPEEALAIFTANPDRFDLVVSDMSMPAMTGIELAERMLAVRPQLPFIITSGFIDAADVEHAQRVGVSQMIMKPNTVEELSLVVASVLRDQQGATAS